jgi:hypothetical protein
MTGETPAHSAGRRMAIRGAAVAIAGLLLSGPVSFALLAMIRKSVAWQGAPHFVENFYRLQVAPFFFGFVLVIGCLMLFAGLHALATDDQRPRSTMSLLLAAAFGSLTTFNYLCQTTFIPAITQHYGPAYEGVIDAFSITNPRSLAWAIEMWSYALLGGATWFVAGMFGGTRPRRLLSRLLVVNGAASVAGAIAAAADMSWLTTPIGVGVYMAWNVLMLAILILVVHVLTPRSVSPSRPSWSPPAPARRPGES